MQLRTLALVLLAMMLMLSACASGVTSDEISQSTPTLTATVTKDQKFNSAVLSLSEEDFSNAGFAFGDSCNVVFSNGYTVNDVPFYNGFYVKTDAPVVVAYPNNKNDSRA